MATLNIPKTYTVASCDFRIFFDTGEALTEGLVSASVDFANQFVEVVIRDDAENLAARALDEFKLRGKMITWEVFTAFDDPLRTMIFTGLEVVGHTMGQDYTACDPIQHHITFAYEDLDIRYEEPRTE